MRLFLDTLIWLRTVLVQDLAILYNRTPSAFVFQAVPFNSVSFRSFARGADSQINDIVQGLQHELAKVPEHLAALFRASIQRMALEQQLERKANLERYNALSRQLTSFASTAKARAPGISHVHQPPSHTIPAMSFPYTANTSYPHSLFSIPAPSSIAHSTVQHQVLSDGLSAGQPHVTLPLAHVQSSKAAVSSDPQHICTVLCIPTMPDYLLAASGQAVHSTGHVSVDSMSKQIASPECDWIDLCKRFPHAQLQSHAWIYNNSGHWCPQYHFPNPATHSNLWIEYTQGVDGCLPTRTLEETWATSWRQKHATEWHRRKRVIGLFETISKRRLWQMHQVFRFLDDKLNMYRTPRSLYTYLGKAGEGYILELADNHKL